MSIVREELPRLGRRQDRRRALGDDVFRAPHRGRGVHRQDLVDDEPVAEHADRGQVLLDRLDRSGVRPDVGGNVERRDVAQPETSRLAPPQELPHRSPVRRPCPRVRDPPREELQEPRHRRRPRVDDHLRQDDLPCPARRGRRHQSLGRHSVTTSPPPTQRPTSSSNRT